MKSYDTAFGKITVKKDGAVSIEWDLRYKITRLSADVVEQMATNHNVDAYGEVADVLATEALHPLGICKPSPLHSEIKKAFIQILRDSS